MINVFLDPQAWGRPSLPLRSVRESDNAFTMPGRPSILSQTPMRVPKENKTTTPFDSQTKPLMADKNGEHNPFSIIPGRLSLAAQTPGRVEKLNAGTRMSLIGRSSLAARSTPLRDARVGLPGRVSLSAQKPLKTVQEDLSGTARDGEVNFDNVRQSLTFGTPQRVSGSEQLDSYPVFNRPSLSVQTPQRVPVDAGKVQTDRFSLAAQTPSRVGRNPAEGKTNETVMVKLY